MVSSKITPYMNMTLPPVGEESNYTDTYVFDFELIDIHDHSPFSGKPITEKSIAWTNYALGLHNMYEVTSVQFKPVTIAPNLSLYFMTDNLGTDLFFKDGNGIDIRITEKGAVTTVSPVGGFLGDFQGYNASVVYTASTNTYAFNIQGAPGGLGAHTITPTVSLSGDYFRPTFPGTFTINSSAFFPVISLLCTEGLSPSIIKQQSTNILEGGPNPRIISSTNMLNSINLSASFIRPIRCFISSTSVDGAFFSHVTATNKPPVNTCVVTITRGTTYPGGRETYRDVYTYQTPSPEITHAYQTPLTFEIGGCLSARPDNQPDVDLLIATAEFKFDQVIPTDGIFHKFLSMTIVLPIGANYTVSVFKEYHAVYFTTNTHYVSAWQIRVNNEQGIKTQNYYCNLRI